MMGTSTTSTTEETYLIGVIALPDGDANGDGVFNHADVMQVQRYLMNAPEKKENNEKPENTESAKLYNWYEADMYNDGKLNANDLVMMKRELLRHSSDS